MKLINKKRIRIGIITVATVLIFVALLLNNSNSVSDESIKKEIRNDNVVNLSVSEYALDVEIDCLRNESAYLLLLNTTEYKIYYANSDARHFIFANFSSSLNGKTILVNTTYFEYDLSPVLVDTPFLKSKRKDTVLELSIERILVENDFNLSINTLSIRLQVVPFVYSASPAIIYPPEVETKTKTKIYRIGFLQDLDTAFKKNPIFGILFGGLIIGIPCMVIACAFYYNYKFTHMPPLIVKTLNKETINLGRFLLEKESERLPGFRSLWFKKDSEHAGIRIVDCQDSYAIVNDASRKRVNVFQMINLDYHHLIYTLPKRLQYYDHLPIKCKRNGLLAWLIRDFPNLRLAKYLQTKILLSPEETLVTEIEVLENRNAVTRVTPVIDVKYIQKISDEKKGETDKPIEWKTIPYYEIFRLEQDKSVRKIETKNPRMELLNIRNREVAEQFQDSVASVRTSHYVELKEYQKESEETVKQLTNLLETLNYNTLTSARDQAKKIVEIQTKAIPNVEQIWEEYEGYKRLGFPLNDAKQLAIDKASKSRFLEEQQRINSANPNAKELIETKAQKEMLEKLLIELKNKDENTISNVLKGIELTPIEGGNNKKKVQIGDDYKS